ncbi:helix-turn-helix domain-containing protein [Mycobacterium spongiae]|uniref:Helix-turn-helix domain-containing protein n=1 Tax=Mycobacterium spongiae TaxID=886343 RepID=A0A975JY12_9MYCO|nr:AraC family transcriptional regulator [Mycobacterium spongiae]QUR67174.1 helix-turn-helix domain-containing protein [Mycobacterium spongiae]
MFEFRKRTPDPPLSRVVASLWCARGTVPYTREKIAPTGSTVAVMVLGDPIIQVPDNGAGEALVAERGLLVGPHDRPVVNEPTGETHAVGIVTTPIGCEAVFGIRPAEIRGRVVDLEGTWPPARSLRTAIAARTEPEGKLDVVERHLADAVGLDSQDSELERWESAVALISADPSRPIAQVAEAVGLSHGHLDRGFTRVVGLSPRSLARLLRMRRLLDGINSHRRVPWTDLAAELGWFDQSHLIRDFKRHTGVTPSAYLAAQRNHLPPDDADTAGFVPER